MLLQSLHRGNVGRLLVEMKVDELMDAEMAAAAVRIQSIARGAKVSCSLWLCVVYDLVCLWTQGRKRADVKMEELIDAEDAAINAGRTDIPDDTVGNGVESKESLIDELNRLASEKDKAEGLNADQAEVDAADDDDKETLVNELMSLVSLCCLSYSAIQTRCMHQITKASLDIILYFCL